MKRVLQLIKQGGVVVEESTIFSTLKNWLTFLGNGTYVLRLERKREQRSIPQNKLMWLWFTAIAEEWSAASGRTFTSQDVHDAYCMLFLPRETPKGLRYGGSTSSLTTEGMTDFLNKVQADAQTEYGIILPNPDDHIWDMWIEQLTNQE